MMKLWKRLACICAGILCMNGITAAFSANDAYSAKALSPDWENVNCSSGDTPYQRIDVSDAVLLARFLAEDTEVTITEQGKINANVVVGDGLTLDDVSKILRFVARLVDFDELGSTSK